MTTADSQARSVALVTGASRGLGRVLAEFLGAQGFLLVLNARDPASLGSVVNALVRDGVRARGVPGDVSESTCQLALTSAVAEHGRLDLLFNNASDLGPTPLPRLAEYPTAAFERVLRVNVVAPLELTQQLLPFLERAHGRVVNITSDAAVGGYPGWGGYGASKAALDLLSLTLAHELEASGVSVVSVDPGDMRTSMHQAAYPGEDISDRPLPEITLPFWAWLLNQNPSQLSGHRFRAQADRWEVPI